MKMAMSNIIQARMDELDMNNSELARLSGVKVQSVQQWLNGKTRPKVERLPQVATALETTVAHLMEEDAPTSNKPRRQHMSRQKRKNIPNLVKRRVETLAPDAQIEALKMIEAFARAIVQSGK